MPVIDGLILEVKRANVFFSKHNSSDTINRVMITGGTALMPGLLMYMASNLDLEVQVANPVANLIVSSKLEKRKNELIEQAPRYSTAIGLALRGL